MPNIRLTPILPKLPKASEFRQAFEKAALKTANLVERDLKSTTRTWTHQPKFSVNILPTNVDYTIIAGTDDEIYSYVDAGTRPHPIRPKRSKYLRFTSGYRSKTRVNIIGSREGGSFGDEVFSKGVNHPGFAGRNFLAQIARRRQVTLEQEISQAIAKVMRQSKR